MVFMPLIAFVLALTLPVSEEVKIGLLIMGCMPGGTTSNIFTYFSRGNLALSVLMTVNSTVFGVVLIPLLLVLYAHGLNIEIPAANIIVTLLCCSCPWRSAWRSDAGTPMWARWWNSAAGRSASSSSCSCW